ncbi:hypothetical protein IEQ34_021032 [Dendrobium chrysotoxum]|uniref:Uncharacterized protein n=1 Tax=Dendrobium chrysotoxum TaxID=161865 RepID=A0AAV7G2G9_DENCH|nr:hypothetical protein IEQ34_021032 [Dendrobium chrysotoxum]
MVMRAKGGIGSSSPNPIEKGTGELENFSEEGDSSQITKTTDLKFSNHSLDIPMSNSSLEMKCYKKLGQMRATNASECGSSTGSIENNESMRI